MKSHKIYGNNIVTVDDILDKSQLEKYIILTENAGYEKATVNMTKGVHVLQPKLRKIVML